MRKSRRDTCPSCGQDKDRRADTCQPCRFVLNHPRLGTGKDWHETPSGYLTKCVGGVKLLQHRVVMENHLGRELLADEHVHHVDGDKKNNCIENLVVYPAGEHRRAHMTREVAKEMSVKGHEARWGYIE